MTILAAAVLAAPSSDLKGAASSGAGQQNDSAFAAVFDRIASKTAADKDAPQSGLPSALPPGQKGGTPALPGSLERPSRHDRPAGSDRNAATGRSPVTGDDQQQLGSILTTPPQGLGLGLAALAQAAVPPQQSPSQQLPTIGRFRPARGQCAAPCAGPELCAVEFRADWRTVAPGRASSQAGLVERGSIAGRH